MPEPPPTRKIAFVGSHGVRKTTAAFSFAAALRHRGVATEVLHEVVRSSPLGFNESASGEAQLWVLLTQVQRELELAARASVVVADRSILDNYAYALRVWGRDRFGIEPFVAHWAGTYDLLVRLLPDIPLVDDAVRSTDPRFRDEIERLVDQLLPRFVAPERVRVMSASQVTSEVDWSDLFPSIIPTEPTRVEPSA